LSKLIPYGGIGEGLKMAKEKDISCGLAAASGAEETVSGSSCCGCVKHKYRDVNSKEYKQMIRRLKLIEGQVRGIEKMVEEDRYCIDILIQVSAIQSALNAFNKELLAQHIHSCVVDDIRNGKDEVVDELVAAVQKLMK
jgi:DNA-binding FrmR family transcriptional regulator